MLIEVNKVNNTYSVTPNVTPSGGLQPDLGIVYDGFVTYFDNEEDADMAQINTQPSGNSKCVYTTNPDAFFYDMSQNCGYKCILINSSGSEIYDVVYDNGFKFATSEWKFHAGDKIRIGYTSNGLNYQDEIWSFNDNEWLLPYIEHTVTQQEVDELHS